MKLTEFKDLINSEITWICISASAAGTGGVTFQIEQAENGVDVTLSKSGEGKGFDSEEESFAGMKLTEVTDRIMKINGVSLVQSEDDDNIFSFDDDADLEGNEYEISFGIDEYIVMSINGCDFQSKSINLFLKVITSMFREGQELIDFINGNY